MAEVIIPLIRPEQADADPTALEIQRWEDDGGAACLVPQRRGRDHHAANRHQRAAA